MYHRQNVLHLLYFNEQSELLLNNKQATAETRPAPYQWSHLKGFYHLYSGKTH